MLVLWLMWNLTGDWRVYFLEPKCCESWTGTPRGRVANDMEFTGISPTSVFLSNESFNKCVALLWDLEHNLTSDKYLTMNPVNTIVY